MLQHRGDVYTRKLNNFVFVYFFLSLLFFFGKGQGICIDTCREVYAYTVACSCATTVMYVRNVRRLTEHGI